MTTRILSALIARDLRAQVDYHRRLVATAGTVGTMGIPELATARRSGDEVPLVQKAN